MDRRRFLFVTASLSAAGIVGGFASPLRAAVTRRTAPRLLRLDAATQRFLPIATVSGMQSVNALRLHIEAFLPAADSRLAALRMEALFGAAQAPWRHLAWHYVQGDALGSSRAAGFDLGVDAFHGLALQWQTQDVVQPIPCVAAAELAALGPGRYLLVLGDDAVLPAGLPFSGNWRNPLLQASVDYFSLRVEAVHAAPDLATRADLACLACADEAIAA